MNIKQQGVGLVEVLVALVLLAISVLGFAALQLRAVDSSLEANKQVIALTIARDLAEKMRANPHGLIGGEYKIGAVAVPAEVQTTAGNTKEIAEQDLQNASFQANKNGMNLAVTDCPSGEHRQCIYVAWGSTSLSSSKGSGKDDVEVCIKDGVYVKGSQCLFLEAY